MNPSQMSPHSLKNDGKCGIMPLITRRETGIMKSVMTKILALLLASLMVLPMLAACGETTENPTPDE